MYARIIVDITHEKLDRVFEYSIPSDLEGMLKVGTEVLVPFGRGNKETRGYIVGFSKICEFDPEKVKSISGICEDGIDITARLVALAAWMKEHYGGTMIQALKTVLPIKKKERVKEKRYVRRMVSKEEGERYLEQFLGQHQQARARLMAALLDDEVIAYELLKRKLNITKTVVDALKERGLLTIETEQEFRNPIRAIALEQKDIPLIYTEEQQNAIHCFCRDYEAGIKGTYLVHGVTGSGKTEVYIEMIRKVVEDGRQAIVLIPEIALTYQTVMRFYRKFGERVSILNSRMSAGERFDQMERAKKGELDVMIGPRSALFTPFSALGLIVIDEEHEGTYKSEQTPRYHARETAEARAALEGASVVLGSATPSLESYYRAEKGEYKLLTLQNRATRQKLPEAEIVDLREELRKGNRSILSERLHELMEDRLRRGEQIILFLNRRGYAGFLACRSCGYVVKCPHCDVSLSSHRNGKLVCHYCGYETPMIHVCPECGSEHIGAFRAGTQQIEELVKREFPEAQVLRMDMDTTKTKDGHEKVLSAFANEEADILIGTQMIVKGHDFPKVTLVGILAADMSLYTDDYRAGERTFQLLVQAAGRAGRGELAGNVVIQTYSPEHYSIVDAAKQDYEQFYKEEMKYRSLMGYPPAEQLMAVLLSSEDELLLERGCRYLKEYMQMLLKKQKKEEIRMELIGPASPYVGKVNDVYRRIIYIKSETEAALIEVKDQTEAYIEINEGYRKIRIQFDLNPMGVF